MAVRFPREASTLLHVAATSFDHAADPVGRLLAEIAATLADARAGTLERPEKRKARLRECYEAVAKGVVNLPRFEDLATVTPGSLSEPEDVPPGWEGWLVRLYVAVTACDSPGTIPPRAAAVFGPTTPAELVLGESPALGVLAPRRPARGERCWSPWLSWPSWRYYSPAP